MATDWLMSNLGLVVVVFVLFVLGLALALRTASGRDALAGAAVRLAVAFLDLAERWLGGQLEARAGASQVEEIAAARSGLVVWMEKRR